MAPNFSSVMRWTSLKWQTPLRILDSLQPSQLISVAQPYLTYCAPCRPQSRCSLCSYLLSEYPRHPSWCAACAPPSVLLLVQISISQESLPGSLHVPRHHLTHLVFTCHHFKLWHIIICVASYLMLVVYIMLQALWQEGQIASGPYQFPGHSVRRFTCFVMRQRCFQRDLQSRLKKMAGIAGKWGKRRQILLIQAISHLLFIDYLLPARSMKAGRSGCSLTRQTLSLCSLPLTFAMLGLTF